MRVVIRYDDCSAISSLELERDLIQAFADCGAQLTMGVVPFVASESLHDPRPQRLLALPAAKAKLLQEAAANGHVEIALHGYSHQARERGKPGEFAGLPVAEQRRRLREGREELARRLGASITTFIPPWNAYDETTVQALKEEGWDCLSASLRGPFPRNAGVQFLPASCRFKNLLEVVQDARRLGRAGSTLVVMLHDFSFAESGQRGAELTVTEFASGLRRLLGEPNLRLCSLRQACRDGGALSLESLIQGQRWSSLCKELPWRIRLLLEDQILWASPDRHRGPPFWYYQACLSVRRLCRDLAPSARRGFQKAFHWAFVRVSRRWKAKTQTVQG